MTILNFKLSTITSGLYFTLLTRSKFLRFFFNLSKYYLKKRIVKQKVFK